MVSSPNELASSAVDSSSANSEAELAESKDGADSNRGGPSQEGPPNVNDFPLALQQIQQQAVWQARQQILWQEQQAMQQEQQQQATQQEQQLAMWRQQDPRSFLNMLYGSQSAMPQLMQSMPNWMTQALSPFAPQFAPPMVPLMPPAPIVLPTPPAAVRLPVPPTPPVPPPSADYAKGGPRTEYSVGDLEAMFTGLEPVKQVKVVNIELGEMEIRKMEMQLGHKLDPKTISSEQAQLDQLPKSINRMIEQLDLMRLHKEELESGSSPQIAPQNEVCRGQGQAQV